MAGSNTPRASRSQDGTPGSTSSTGLWEREAPQRESDVMPITWKDVPRLRDRISRAVTVPTLIGGGVFLLAILITAFMMFRAAGASSHAIAGSGETPPASILDTLAEESDHSTEGDGTIIVHVVGEVRSPGVVELRAGARVRDAIDGAGGAGADARLERINLARSLVDGEQVTVPNSNTATSGESQQVQGFAAIPDELRGSAVPSGQVNLNLATAEELEGLPKIGPALAGRIIDWREANGGFNSVDQLLEVSGIGVKMLEHFRDQVTV